MANIGQLKLSNQKLKLIAKALSDPRRFQILQRLGGCNVRACSDLRAHFPVTAATLSHHMRELEDAGLVESAKEGKFINYRLRREVLNAYIRTLSAI